MDGSVFLINEEPEIKVQNFCVLKVVTLVCVTAVEMKVEEKCSRSVKIWVRFAFE